MVDFGTISTACVTSTPVTHLVIVVDLVVERAIGNDAFFHSLLGLVMTSTKYEMLAKFLKLKPNDDRYKT